MRAVFTILIVLTAGCGSRPSEETPSAEPQAIAYDGAVDSDVASRIRHGSRLASVLGCRGCHGNRLEGERFAKDHPEYGPIYASNLTRAVPRFSDAQLEGILRNGTHPEREAVWSMPSEMFHDLSRAGMGALIAYLRSLPPAGQATPPPQFSAQDRKDIASGDYKPAPAVVVDALKRPPRDLGANHALGRYIAATACTECHGSNLEGRPNDTPDLVVASGYSRGEFEKLMTTGVPVGGRKLRMMDGVARGRFVHLTPHERDALYAYLKARAEQP